MKILPLLVIGISLLSWTEGLGHFYPRSAGQQRTISYSADNDNNAGLLDTFSLSFVGNFSFSKALEGIRKIVEGIATCKHHCETKRIPLLWGGRVRAKNESFTSFKIPARHGKMCTYLEPTPASGYKIIGHRLLINGFKRWIHKKVLCNRLRVN